MHLVMRKTEVKATKADVKCIQFFWNVLVLIGSTDCLHYQSNRTQNRSSARRNLKNIIFEFTFLNLYKLLSYNQYKLSKIYTYLKHIFLAKIKSNIFLI